MQTFIQFAYFLFCTITLVIGVLAVFAGITAIASKSKQKAKGHLSIKPLNKRFKHYEEQMQQATLDKKALKQSAKADKKQNKQDKAKRKAKPNCYVLRFDGDIRASATPALTEAINAILISAKPNDQVLLKLESGGGMVPHYGLASAQLLRLKQADIKLTIAIDRVAASGGYMMACVADNIIAAPFAIIGSIGVIVQLPNLHRFLKHHNVDFEQLMAGQYKRTLTVLGENTEAGREKMQQEIDETHDLFKRHIEQCRPVVDLAQVATGEHWYGQQAIDLKLVDNLQTSDDYLLSQREQFNLFEINYKIKQPLGKKLLHASDALLSALQSNNRSIGI